MTNPTTVDEKHLPVRKRSSRTIRSQEDADRAHIEFAKSGEGQIADALTIFYRPLATSLASRMTKSASDRDDVQQVAMLGLFQALRAFDPDFGTRFSTFAWKTIAGCIRKYFRDNASTVKIPRALQERRPLVMMAIETLTHEAGKSPSIAEVARLAGVSEETVIEVLETLHRATPVSIDTGGSEGGQMNIASNDERLGNRETLIEAQNLLLKLPQRSHRIFTMRFLEDLTQTEIAKQMGISQMQVSRILSDICTQLRYAVQC